MREGIVVEVSAADRARLETVVADRNSSQKHAWRAGIVLATADDHPRQVVHTLTAAVDAACGGRLADDATVLCLDWYGPAGDRAA